MNSIAFRGSLGRCLLKYALQAQHSTSSIDSENMRLLSDFKDCWLNPRGPMQPLHAMNKIRIPFIREGLINTGAVSKENHNTTRVLQGLTILDVGCGGGILSKSLAKLRANVTGLEPAKELFDVAKEHAEQHENEKLNLTYLNTTIEELTTDEKYLNAFDCVVLSEVIEHVNHPSSFLEHCVKALKPGGSLIVTTFNKTIPSLVLGIGAAEYLLRMVPQNTHDWDKFIPLDDMHKIIESNNCSVLQTAGTLYLPWINTWKLIRNTDVSYAIHAVKH